MNTLLLKGTTYVDLGCWKDNSSQPSMTSLDADIVEKYNYTGPFFDETERKNNPIRSINECFALARDKKYTFFALQNGYQCFASSKSTTLNVPNSYKKYSRSRTCDNDKMTGGPLANQVYEIIEPDTGISSLAQFHVLIIHSI